jgi:hypothetical protein
MSQPPYPSHHGTPAARGSGAVRPVVSDMRTPDWSGGAGWGAAPDPRAVQPAPPSPWSAGYPPAGSQGWAGPFVPPQTSLPPPLPPGGRRRRRWWILGAVVVAGLVLLGGIVLVALDLAAPKPVAVRGELQLVTTGYLSPGTSCEGTGGYSDIGPGQSVMLRDASGRLLAATHLTGGQWTSSGVSRGVCTFQFQFAGVVLDGEPNALYTVAVGTSDRRGEVPFTRDELLAGAILTLGS